MTVPKVVVVTGAGGFIGGHLVGMLRADPHITVRAADIKPLSDWYQTFPDVENLAGPLEGDVRDFSVCRRLCAGASEVYQLAADMGGMGFIENNKALCMLSVLSNTHALLAAQEAGVRRFFFSSSACVYNADRQLNPNVIALRESDAYPALPEDGYGWEKLFSERMCRHFREDFGMETRVARFHNVYGPHGTWFGGREKAPAAICRKVAVAKLSGHPSVEIWGDGSQTRSFTFISDCLEGIDRIMRSTIMDPINLGSSEMVTINQLVDITEEVAGVRLGRSYKLDAPRGVAGRNSDNTRIKEALGWEPSTALRDGIRATYQWIESQYRSLIECHGVQEAERLTRDEASATHGSPAIPGDGHCPTSRHLDTWIKGIPERHRLECVEPSDAHQFAARV
jgi:GDP-D-mannose 3',5'-epimerase